MMELMFYHQPHWEAERQFFSTSVGTLGQLNVTGVTTSSGGFDGNLTGTIKLLQTNITSLGTLSSLVVSGITSSSAFADFDYLQAPFGSTISFTLLEAKTHADTML